MQTTKNAPQPTYEISDASGLNKFLLGLLRDTRSGAVQLDVADASSKVADKIIKNNLTRIMYMRTKDNAATIDFFEGVENNMMISKA